MAPWHVSSYFWPFFEPCLSIFSVQNRFSHIFPAPGGSPHQSLFLRSEVEKGLRAVYSEDENSPPPPSTPHTSVNRVLALSDVSRMAPQLETHFSPRTVCPTLSENTPFLSIKTLCQKYKTCCCIFLKNPVANLMEIRFNLWLPRTLFILTVDLSRQMHIFLKSVSFSSTLHRQKLFFLVNFVLKIFPST